MENPGSNFKKVLEPKWDPRKKGSRPKGPDPFLLLAHPAEFLALAAALPKLNAFYLRPASWRLKPRNFWRARQDSNLRPTDS
jgi:hypothetical protein